MDKIQGPGNSRYDPQYLQVSRRLTAESVKPNVFKETDDPAKLLNTKDFVALSPEAKELLKQLRKDASKKGLPGSKEEDFEKLLGGLKKMKQSLSDDENEDDGDNAKKESKGKRLFFQEKDGKFIVPLNETKVGDEQSPRPRASFSRFSHIIEPMLVSDTSNAARNLVIKELDPLGEKMLGFVKNFGIHIIILDKSQNLTQRRIKGMMIVAPGERSFDGRPWEVVRGIYCQDRRLIVAGEELLGRLNGSVMRHEFAHAFDHAYTKKNQRRLPLSVQLWNSFAPSRKSLPSAYAATNPAEYFAESVDAYFIPEGRQYLKVNDPQMNEYLDVLFDNAS